MVHRELVGHLRTRVNNGGGGGGGEDDKITLRERTGPEDQNSTNIVEIVAVTAAAVAEAETAAAGTMAAGTIWGPNLSIPSEHVVGLAGVRI